MKLLYPAVFKPLSEKRSGYCVVFPDLPGCITQGDSLEDALEMAVDAASGWILTSMEDGEQLPKPSNRSDITINTSDEFINYVSLDMEEYAKQYSKKSVKKTLTIPGWLNYAAERAGVNFSQVLQNGIKEQLKLTPDAQSSISTISYKQAEIVDNIIKNVSDIMNTQKKAETVSQTEYTTATPIYVESLDDVFKEYRHG